MIGAVSYLNHSRLIPYRSDMDRRISIGVQNVPVGPRGQEGAHRFHLTLINSRIQRRVAFVVFGVDIWKEFGDKKDQPLLLLQ